MTKDQQPMTNFISPTHGKLTLVQVREKVLSFIEEMPEKSYRLVVGTDSNPPHNGKTDFVTAVIVHRKGQGGVYFWQRTLLDKNFVLRERIYQEAYFSLRAAEQLLDIIKKERIGRYDVEIHVDIGPYGETREMINEVVGMVRGLGFKVAIKPEAFGASKVADRHT